MKTPITITLVLCLATGLTANAQNKKDSLAIEKACRDYVEGWVDGDVDRVRNAVSPNLIKRTIGTDQDGSNFTFYMSASMLISSAKRNKGGTKAKDFEPGKAFSLDVSINDITGDYASVKAVNTKYGFFDYCQLAKYDGQWKIFNVFWGDLAPPSQPPVTDI